MKLPGFGENAISDSDGNTYALNTPEDWYLRKRPQDKRLAAGVNLNDIGLLDPTQPDKSPWVDAISGASVRNGLPARMKRA
jgi:hypothetical protein